MTLRVCVYKGCENLYMDGKPAGNYTMFSFPRDADRAGQWRILGQVANKIPLHQCLMCSDHFDCKFVSISNKRKILVGEAVPYAYKNGNTTEAADPKDAVHDPLQENKVISFPTAEPLGIKINGDVDKPFKRLLVENNHKGELRDSVGNIVTVKQTTLTRGAASEYINNKTKRPRKDFSANSSSIYDDFFVCTDSDSCDEPIEDVLIDKSKVSTFVFKGEEYVQMSKMHYLAEKRNILRKLQDFKDAFKIIKTQVEVLHLN